MDFVYHPAFQSALLPLLLALAGVALLRWLAAPWAAWGGVFALLGALAVVPGFVWPARTGVQQLPWLVLGAAVLGALAAVLGPRRPVDRVGLAAALVVSALGLTALAALGGSLLLAQLALVVAIATAVPGLWAWGWPQSGVGLPASALLPMGVAAALVAWALPGNDAAGMGRLALLALALTAPLWTARLGWAQRHARWAPLLVVALASVPVLLAIAWLLLGAGDAAPSAGDDPYYQPRWN